MKELDKLQEWVNDYMDELLVENDIDGAVVAMSVMVQIDKIKGLTPSVELEVL